MVDDQDQWPTRRAIGWALIACAAAWCALAVGVVMAWRV